MRSRNIKPGFFKNEDLAKCHPFTQLLFIGIWQLADRAGRLEYRPDRIYAEVFPYKTPEQHLTSTMLAPYKNHEVPCIAYMITQLIENEFLQPYISNGVEYLSIVNFLIHQNPHVKEKKSVIPEPPEFISKKTRTFESVIKNHYEHGASMVQAQCEHGADPAESLLLNPESCIVCAEQKSSPPPDPPKDIFISILLNDCSEFGVDMDFMAQLINLYPAVNVEQELRNMKGWCLTNPKKRKTIRGIKAFINSWLKREQDRPKHRPIQGGSCEAYFPD